MGVIQIMKVAIFDAQKKKAGDTELPQQFSEPFRPDLIKRAVLAIRSSERQSYGSHVGAGKRYSSTVSKRRRDYRGSYGFGISRVNRKVLSRRGTRMFWVGATSPHTRGGFRAHPPKVEKVWKQKINTKENQKAIRSAMGATVDKVLVTSRGHKIPAEYPFVVVSALEAVAKTSEVVSVLGALGFESELERTSESKIRAGKGKSRGRKYITKKGLLIVVSETCPLSKAAINIPGVDVVSVSALNCSVLAPGSLAGRVTLWTQKAVEALEKNHLFC